MFMKQIKIEAQNSLINEVEKDLTNEVEKDLINEVEKGLDRENDQELEEKVGQVSDGDAKADLSPEIEVPTTDGVVEVQLPVAADVGKEVQLPAIADVGKEVQLPAIADIGGEVQLPVAADVGKEVQLPAIADVGKEVQLPDDVDIVGEVQLPVAADIVGEVQLPDDVDIVGEVQLPDDVDIVGEVQLPTDADVGGEAKLPDDVDVGEEAKLPVEVFLEAYAFRMNVLSGKTEYRKRESSRDRKEVPVPQGVSGSRNVWMHLDKRALNALAVEARKAMPKERGLKQMLSDIIYSNSTPEWDPIREWLMHLPEWDGRNRVVHLFSHIPGVTSENLFRLSVWLRSTVAHWLQMDELHANETVVTLIGAQGCGKSTFCRRLLPPHLREYYLDHVHLSNKFDKEMALTNNLIVNLDELDQIRPSQQAELKQMLSKVRVNGRPIYGREQRDRNRYASFVATTNNRHPLRDRTGSRRYLCIEVEHGREIDNSFEIDYEQLYAQVVAEIRRDERFWFDNSEANAIQHANAQYQDTLDLTTMIQSCYRLPREDEYAEPLSADEILNRISTDYPAIKLNSSTRVRLGLAMQQLGFLHKKGRDHNCYFAVPLSA